MFKSNLGSVTIIGHIDVKTSTSIVKNGEVLRSLSLSLSFTLSKMLYLFLSLSLVCTQKHSIMFSHKHTTFLSQKFSLYFSQHVTHNLSLPLSLTASLINHCTIVYLFSVYLSRCPTCYLPSYLPTYLVPLTCTHSFSFSWVFGLTT